MKEYKVLGRGTVEVNGQHEEMLTAMMNGIPLTVEGILNKLAEEGWEPVLLQAPFIFSREKDQ